MGQLCADFGPTLGRLGANFGPTLNRLQANCDLTKNVESNVFSSFFLLSGIGPSSIHTPREDLHNKKLPLALSGKMAHWAVEGSLSEVMPPRFIRCFWSDDRTQAIQMVLSLLKWARTISIVQGLCWPGTLFLGSRNVSNVPNVPNTVPNIPRYVPDMWPISACSGSRLAQACSGSAHACSALASDPNANKAKGGSPPPLP